MNGASAALMVSDIPFPQPVGAVRIGKIEGNFVVNPSEEAMQEADIDLVVSGTDEAILMVECGANEMPEAEILDALDIAHGAIKKLVAVQHELREKAGKTEARGRGPAGRRGRSTSRSRSSHGAEARRGHLGRGQARPPGRHQGRRGRRCSTQYSGDPRRAETYGEYRAKAQLAFDKLEKTIIRQRIAIQKKRPDGRGTDEIRDISIEAGVLPRTHGSALFTRGQTQALSVAALGTTREEMRLDNLGLETSKRYFHHYNFPPFSVGEAGFMRGPKRRDIGHGALAERALVPMIPSPEEFPYTIRVVSDILESNGSSSMASVCGSSLSLMDAGVPIKRPVAGIAMGLIKEGDDYVVLSDIAGVEDHLGDMDFKVAGTERGITALQMDIKITGVTFEILRDALAQAKEGRTHILGKMAEVIDGPARGALAVRAAHLDDPDRPGQDRPADRQGRRDHPRPAARSSTRRSTSTTRATSSSTPQTGAQGDALIDRIRSMTKEVEVGDEFQGKVVKTTTFGAFVELAKGTDGLLHISNVSPGQRVDTVEEVLNKGDEIAVRVVEVDKERGRIGLRLAEDPEIAGKTVEELAAVGSGGGGGWRRPWPAAAAATATAAAAAATAGAAGATVTAARARRAATATRTAASAPGHLPEPPHHGARLGAADRHGGTCPPSGPRPWASSWPPARAARRPARPGSRTSSSTCCSAAPTATPRRRSTSCSTAWAPSSTPAPTRRPRRSTRGCSTSTCRAAFDVMADMVWRPAFHDVDPEREVVLEEIAMYEDDPQDTVFDVLGEAVFGDHPLGRPIIGRAPVIRDTPVDEIAAFHARRYVPALGRHRGGGLGRPRRDRGAGRAHARRQRAGGGRARARPGPGGAAQHRALPAQGHRAGPRLPRRPRPAARRRPPLRRCACSTRSSAGCPPRGSSRPCARSAGWPTRVYSFAGQFADTGQIGLYVGTRPDNLAEAMEVVARRARAGCASEPATEDELVRARENVKAPRRARHGVHRRAHEPPRRLAALRPAAAGDRRDHGAHRRRDARRPARAGRRAVGARAAVRRRHRPRRGRVLRRPSSGGARPQASRRRHDPRRRRRRRGAHGADRLRRRRGRRRTWS